MQHIVTSLGLTFMCTCLSDALDVVEAQLMEGSFPTLIDLTVNKSYYYFDADSEPVITLIHVYDPYPGDEDEEE